MPALIIESITGWEKQLETLRNGILSPSAPLHHAHIIGVDRWRWQDLERKNPELLRPVSLQKQTLCESHASLVNTTKIL